VTVPNGNSVDYVLSASCKTEKVAVDRDIWMTPNGDFCVVSSDQHFMILNRWQQCDMKIERESDQMAAHAERQVGVTTDAWTSHCLDIDMVEARVLTSNHQIVEAALGKCPIVGRTEFDLEDGGRCLIEYPVKTLNASDQHLNYQIDTGPVLYPDRSIGHQHFIGNFRLAFIAHHCPQWAELIVNAPTEVSNGVRVHHYSETLRVDGKNTMLAVG